MPHNHFIDDERLQEMWEDEIIYRNFVSGTISNGYYGGIHLVICRDKVEYRVWSRRDGESFVFHGTHNTMADAVDEYNNL